MCFVIPIHPPIHAEPAFTLPSVTFQLFMLSVFFTIVMLYVLPIFRSLSTQIEDVRQLLLLVRQLSGFHHDGLV
jgi:hypothetical protein